MQHDKYAKISGADADNGYDGLDDLEMDGFDDADTAGWQESDNRLLSAVLASANSDPSTNTTTIAKENGSNEEGSGELFGLEEDSSTMDKIVIISQQSGPVIASFFLGLIGTFINLLFAGRFIPTDGDRSVVFAGISLANMFVNVSCLSLLIGMSSAVETLGSQHNGAGNYVEVGLVLQRSIAVLFAMAVPLMILWFFVYDIYIYIGVERDVCEVIKEYVYIRALAVPIDIVNESYEKYLMSIGAVQPAMWSNVAFSISLVALNSLFVFGFGWGYRSLAFSWVLSTLLMFLVLMGLSLYIPSVRRTLQPWDRRALQEWPQFIKLGLPGTVMLCSEWWAFEFLMLLATFLGTPQVAAQAIMLQISSISFMVPLGIGVTCASFVGNAIGAGKVALAQQIGKLCLGYTAVIDMFLAVIILFGGDQFVALFTSDPEVIQVTDSAIPFLSAFVMIDGLQGVASGVLRGAGRQYLGAVANVFAYYAVGLPMAYLICFHLRKGVDGLMIGIAFGSLTQVAALFSLIFVFEKYLYGAVVVRKDGEFMPVSMDESAHSTHGLQMGSLNSKGQQNGTSVYSTLHPSVSNLSVDVTVDESSSEEQNDDNDFTV